MRCGLSDALEVVSGKELLLFECKYFTLKALNGWFELGIDRHHNSRQR
jgi:hypothetical protein